MDTDQYEKLFSEIALPEPPVGLATTILIRIERRERRILAVKAMASATVFALSLWVIAVGYSNLIAGVARSGFLTFVSLLFSDFSSIASNLPDFLFSIVESFPVFSAATLLGGIAFALWSIGRLVDETSRMHRQFATHATLSL